MNETLKFYDVKSREKFESSDYDIRQKGERYFAVTKSPTGSHECWRVLSKDAAEKLVKNGAVLTNVPLKKSAGK